MIRIVFAVLAAGALSGCVQPDGLDPTILNRYQEQMAARGPQARDAQDGLGLLRPSPVASLPRLAVTPGKKDQPAVVRLTLDEAVLRALANNAEIRVESFSPAIAREDMRAAAAEFDYVLFGGWSRVKDDRRTDSTLGGGQTRVREASAGVKQKTVTGATWSAEYTWNRTWDNSGAHTLTNRYEPTIVASVTQPLLRDAWPAVNLARMRIASISESASRSAFRAKVEDVVTTVVTTYWSLRQARRDLEIQQWLLDEARATLEKLRLRQKLDVTAVEIRQTEAAVRTREAALVRARRTIGDLQDALVRLLSDPQLNLLSGAEVVPVTEAADVRIRLDEADQLVTALRHSPLLEQARLAIAVADVNVRVACNQTLPRLDFTAAGTLQGLGGSSKQGHDELFTGDYAGYNFALTFEYPIGNRERQALLRKARFERLQAVAGMQNTADQVAQSVRQAMRQVAAAHEELLAQRQAVEAAMAQLKALEDLEELRARMSPEFLRLKLSAQETIASARRSELQAITDYNTALIRLAQATGTVLQGTVVTSTAMELSGGLEGRLPVTWGESPWGAGELKKKNQKNPTTQDTPKR